MIAKAHLAARSGSVTPSGVPIGGALVQIGLWLERRRQRRALLSLNDHLLKDIGVSRAEAWLEGQKPFWRD